MAVKFRFGSTKALLLFSTVLAVAVLVFPCQAASTTAETLAAADAAR